MNYLAASGRGVSEGFLFLIRPKGCETDSGMAGRAQRFNINQEILRLRLGSVRLNNFVSQN